VICLYLPLFYERRVIMIHWYTGISTSRGISFNALLSPIELQANRWSMLVHYFFTFCSNNSWPLLFLMGSGPFPGATQIMGNQGSNNPSPDFHAMPHVASCRCPWYEWRYTTRKFLLIGSLTVGSQMSKTNQLMWLCIELRGPVCQRTCWL